MGVGRWVPLLLAAAALASGGAAPEAPCPRPIKPGPPTEAARSQLAASMSQLKQAQKAVGSLPCPKANQTARKMDQLLQSLAGTHKDLAAAGFAPAAPKGRNDTAVIKPMSKGDVANKAEPVHAAAPPSPGMHRGTASPTDSQLDLLENATLDSNMSNIRQAVVAMASEHQYNPNNEIPAEEKFMQAVKEVEHDEDSGKSNRLSKGVNTYLSKTEAAESTNEKLAKTGELPPPYTAFMEVQPVLYTGDSHQLRAVRHSGSAAGPAPHVFRPNAPVLMPSAGPAVVTRTASPDAAIAEQETASLVTDQQALVDHPSTPGYTVPAAAASAHGDHEGDDRHVPSADGVTPLVQSAYTVPQAASKQRYRANDKPPPSPLIHVATAQTDAPAPAKHA